MNIFTSNQLKFLVHMRSVFGEFDTHRTYLSKDWQRENID